MKKPALSVIERDKVNLDIHCGHVNRILCGRQKVDTIQSPEDKEDCDSYRAASRAKERRHSKLTS